MKRIFLKFGLILALVLSVAVFNSCDRDGADNGGNGKGSATFTLKGVGMEPYYFQGKYWYTVYNHSNSQVVVTANGETRTLTQYAPLTGFRDSYTFISPNSTLSVSYTPCKQSEV